MSAGPDVGRVRIGLLGGFTTAVDGALVADRWRLRKARTLVKLLALAPGHRMHRDTVIEQLWPDAAPTSAANNLHQAVHAARSVLGAHRIGLRGDILTLCPDDELEVDVDVFERAAAHARATGDVAALREALARWSGPLLPEDVYEPWAALPRERLDKIHAEVAAQLAEQLVRTARPEAALTLLEPLAADRPVDESVQRAQIAALAASGRRWDAIGRYEQLRDTLEQEYAAEPDQQTKAL